MRKGWKRIKKRLVHAVQFFDIINKPNSEEKSKIISAAKHFWHTHSIYLEKETREQFVEVLGIVSAYRDYADAFRSETNHVMRAKMKERLGSDFDKLINCLQLFKKTLSLNQFY